MSDWKGRLEAVATLGAPKVYADGEVECMSCHNRKLNRADLTCWKCGADRFLPASDEMKHALRFNYVPPPRMVEAPKAEPPRPTFAQMLAASPVPRAVDPYTRALKQYEAQRKQWQAWHEAISNAAVYRPGSVRPGSIVVYDAPEPFRKRGIVRRIADLLGYPR